MFQLTDFHDGTGIRKGQKADSDNGNVGSKMHLW